MTKAEMLADVYRSDQRLLRFVVGRIVGSQDCMDVIQDVFLKVLKSRREFLDPDDARRYVKRAAINAALDLTQQKRKFVPFEKEEFPGTPIPDSASPDPLFMLLGAQEQQSSECLIRRAVPLLEWLCQEKQVPVALFRGREWGLLTHYSAKLRLPISTLRSRYVAVLQDLKTALSS